MELVNVITPEAEQRTLDGLKDLAGQYDSSCRGAFGKHIGYAFLCGFVLNQAKDLLPHGQFEQWWQANLPQLPKSTLHRYMDWAKFVESHLALSGQMSHVGHLISNGELTKDLEDQIVNAVHDFADGKTMTAMLRDLSLIRQPKQKEYHPPKPSSPEEQVKEEIFMADETGRHLATELIMLSEDRDPSIPNMSDAVRDRLLDACVAVSTRIRGMKRKVATPKQVKKPRGLLSPETKAKMQAAAKARWAKARELRCPAPAAADL
jgi:hypothetical protein